MIIELKLWFVQFLCYNIKLKTSGLFLLEVWIYTQHHKSFCNLCILPKQVQFKFCLKITRSSQFGLSLLRTKSYEIKLQSYIQKYCKLLRLWMKSLGQWSFKSHPLSSIYICPWQVSWEGLTMQVSKSWNVSCVLCCDSVFQLFLGFNQC